MFAARPMAGPQLEMPVPGDADAQAIFVGDFFRGRLRRRLVQVHAHDVRAFLHEPMRSFLADAASRRR